MPRQFVFVILMVTACGVLGDGLTITTWGGNYAHAQRLAFFNPFTSESGHRIVEDMWGGDIARIRSMVERNHYTSSVFDAEEEQVQEGCEAGILEVIDYEQLDFDRQSLLPGADHRCGVGSMVWSMIFAYDPSRVGTDPPKSWRDFWNVRKYPGKRGLYGGLETNLEIALLADGVPPRNVYAELARAEGRAKAFKKLDELKPHVIWWQAGAQPAQWLLDGEVVMTSGWNGRLYRASTLQRTFPLVWQGQLMFFEYWIIPKGHPNREIAYDFISLATRPERQAAMTRYVPYGPVNKEWINFVESSEQEGFPTTPTNLHGALKVKPTFWASHSRGLEQVFMLWLKNFRPVK